MPTLMQRSVIKMGKGGFCITLPKAWTDYFKIKAGDKLQVIADGELTIHPPVKQANDVGVVPAK